MNRTTQSMGTSLFAGAAISLLFAACGSQGPGPGAMMVCGSDKDCKGDRVCLMAICVEPGSGSGGSSAGGSAGIGGGTGSAGASGGAGATGGVGAAGTSGTARAAVPPGLPADKFVGVWRYTGGQRVLDQCDDGSAPMTTQITSGSVTINRGTDGMTATIGSGSCLLRYDVSGNTATARPGQSCSGIVSGTDIQLTLQLVSSVYTTADGATMQSAEVLQITAGNSTGSFSCRRTENAALAKS